MAENLGAANNNNNSGVIAYLTSFPPGYRFKPTDKELITEYLLKKVRDEPLPPSMIHVVDLYNSDPDTLAEQYMKANETEWYFFTPRNRKYRNGKRPNRAAGAGYWKATGADKPIESDGIEVGCRKALVYRDGKPPNGHKTPWIMHEFIVKDSPLPNQSGGGATDVMRLDNWVLCRIYKKTGARTDHDDANSNMQSPHAQNQPACESLSSMMPKSSPSQFLSSLPYAQRPPAHGSGSLFVKPENRQLYGLTQPLGPNPYSWMQSHGRSAPIQIPKKEEVPWMMPESNSSSCSRLSSTFVQSRPAIPSVTSEASHASSGYVGSYDEFDNDFFGACNNHGYFNHNSYLGTETEDFSNSLLDLPSDHFEYFDHPSTGSSTSPVELPSHNSEVKYSNSTIVTKDK